MKPFYVFFLLFLLCFAAYSQSLSLDELKAPRTPKEKQTEKSQTQKLTAKEIEDAKKVLEWYTIPENAPQDSMKLKRTSSWIKVKLNITHDQLIKYLNYENVKPRKEDVY